IMAPPHGNTMEPLDLVPCFVQAGSQLRRSREKTGMRVRDVEQASSRIASEVGNREFFLSNSYLSRLEKGRFVPSAAKMISLCKIYHLHLPELLSWFRMEAATSTSLQARTDARKTHLIGVEIDGPLQTVNFPIRLGAEFNRHQTMLLSRAVGQ